MPAVDRPHNVGTTHEQESAATAPPWLDEVYVLVSQQNLEGAIDLLFDRIDDLLLAGRMQECDKILRAVELGRLESNLLVGLLTATLPAAHSLPYRATLVVEIEAIFLKSFPERVNGLLSGLRGLPGLRETPRHVVIERLVADGAKIVPHSEREIRGRRALTVPKKPNAVLCMADMAKHGLAYAAHLGAVEEAEPAEDEA